MSPQTLSIEGLCLAAGDTPLLHEVGLALRRGQVLALVGASGGGKSLTTAALLGLLPAGVRQRGGTLRLDGVAQDGRAQAALRGAVLGFVQQAPRGGFNPLVTIGRHFLETLACDGLRGGAARDRAATLLREVGFDAPQAVLPLYPSQLSGGMLQRAMIALALARQPAFLLADEPTTDLDLIVQAQILDLLETMVRQRGIGLLLVTHDLSVAARLADRVAVMQAGRIVERAEIEAFFAAPSHPHSRALMAAHLALYGEALAEAEALPA
ncbi:ATP-binding cassette domain-containing protein [Pseudoroseomonas cervicalis]|uniref:ATP-binding cassette domain-containing protein n=1 Tax=Teichococcus cervicalis TaxID=204525 RepID=UPI00277EEF03|nr:ATP-binding cassette domain-containing protein [Pseudoroseomonas cervicalis]MDQ1081871.1 nickel transport system ATP-binding protein [Pseudoroseomonas cervicalis]